MRKLHDDIKFSFHLLSHPFDGFWNLKIKQSGSIRGAILLLTVYALSSLLCTYYNGFIFNSAYGANINLVVEISKAVFPILLWSLSNWCFTTLMSGEGTLKQITSASCYCLIPLIFLNIVRLIFSNILSFDESAFLTVIGGFCYAAFGFLLLVSIIVIHQYTLGKSLAVVLLSVLGIAIMIFMIIFCFNLSKDIVTTIIEIAKEAVFLSR